MKCLGTFSLVASSILSSASGQEGGYKDSYEPSPYHYEYKVHDDKEYLDFGAEEEGDGKGDVHGQYHVQLPDGRLQHVSYHADDYNGYIADVSYDGHAEHPSYHGSDGGHHGHQHGGGHHGHPFGKTLGNADEGEILQINEGHRRLGKTISTQSEEHITNGFTNSRSGKTIGQENSNLKSKLPVKSFPSSGDFSQRFGKPSNTFSGSSGTFQTENKQLFQSSRDFSNLFAQPSSGISGISGQFNTESKETTNYFFSRRTIEPQQSHVSIPKESLDTGEASPVKTFSSFGNEPVQQQNYFFSNRKVQQPALSSLPLHSESTLSSQSAFGNEPIKQENSSFKNEKGHSPSHVKDSFSRHGKSGRQDVDAENSHLFSSSSHPKPVVHVKSTNEKKDINPPKKITSRFGEPKTNDFFGSVGKSSRPDFDSFSPIFDKSSKNKGSENQPKKSFESFSPIFGKQSASPKKFTSEAAKSDTDFFKPSGTFRSGFEISNEPSSFKKSEPFKKPLGSSEFPERHATLTDRSGNPSFVVTSKLSTKQLSTSNKISHPKPTQSTQSAPRFKARAIGFGRNHPVLKSLDRSRQSSHSKSNGQRGSVDNQVRQQGSFRQQTDRRQFGRSLFDEPVRQESPGQQKLQEPENSNHGHRAFITHKAVPA